MKFSLLTKISAALRGVADKINPQKPARVPVESSMIASIGWHEGTLEIEFNSGVVYAYDDVSKSTYTRMINADSVGKYFNRYIRDVYECQVID